MNFETFFLTILSGLFIAVVTAIVTVRLSLRQFYSQKWWEKKEEAYSSILESLHHMNRTYDRYINEVFLDKKISPMEKTELDSKFKIVYDELLKRIDMGQFVLSKKANEELNIFQNEYAKRQNTKDYSEHLIISSAVIKTTMKKLSEIARDDLKGR